MNILHSSIDISDALNTQDNDGNTPTHYATMILHYDIIYALTLKGAKLDISNNNGFIIEPVYNNTEHNSIFNMSNLAEANFNEPKSYSGLSDHIPDISDSFILPYKNTDSYCNPNVPSVNIPNTAVLLLQPLEIPQSIPQQSSLPQQSSVISQQSSLPQQSSVPQLTNNFNQFQKRDKLQTIGGVSTVPSTELLSDSETLKFVKNAITIFTKQTPTNVQIGGTKHVNGSRKMKTYSEINYSGDFVSENSSYDDDRSNLSRMIKNQADEIHQRVIKKIMDIMNVDEENAKIYKYAIYKNIKDTQPSLLYLDRAVEMDKLTTKTELLKIDLDKASKERKDFVSQKMSERKSKHTKKSHKPHHLNQSIESEVSTDKPKKRVNKKKESVLPNISDTSISTESDMAFSLTSEQF